MERFKAFCRRLCFLSPKETLVVAACGFGLLWFTLAHPSPPLLGLLAFFLSVYALVVTVTAAMRLKPAFQQWLQGQAWYDLFIHSLLGDLLVRDPDFRDWFLMALNMLWNIACALAKLAVGMLLGSAWLKSLGVYYLVLAGLRLVLVIPGGAARGWQRYRACGVALLLMNGVLVVMVIRLLLQKGTFIYPGPLIYLMGVYAVYALINATIRLAVEHRRADPIQSAARVISLTAAMVSMLALEVALIERAGGSLFFRRFMVGLTGGIVCTVELHAALYMIRRGKQEIQSAKEEKGL